VRFVYSKGSEFKYDSRFEDPNYVPNSNSPIVKFLNRIPEFYHPESSNLSEEEKQMQDIIESILKENGMYQCIRCYDCDNISSL